MHQQDQHSESAISGENEARPAPSHEPHLDSDPHARRFEFIQEGEVAGFINYYLFEKTAIITHSEVRIHGKGYGRCLGAEALAFFRSQGWQVAPVCGFCASFIRKNIDKYADLLTPATRQAFDL